MAWCCFVACFATSQSSHAQTNSRLQGTWVKVTPAARSDQPGIGAWIRFDSATAITLSWAPPGTISDARGEHGSNLILQNNQIKCWYELRRAGSKLTMRLMRGEPPAMCLEDSVFELEAEQERARPDPVDPRVVQQDTPRKTTAPSYSMSRLDAHWVDAGDGNGKIISATLTRQDCETMCLARPTCGIVEFYIGREDGGRKCIFHLASSFTKIKRAAGAADTHVSVKATNQGN